MSKLSFYKYKIKDFIDKIFGWHLSLGQELNLENGDVIKVMTSDTCSLNSTPCYFMSLNYPDENTCKFIKSCSCRRLNRFDDEIIGQFIFIKQNKKWRKRKLKK